MSLAKKGLMNLYPAMKYYKKQLLLVMLAIVALFCTVAFCAPKYSEVTDMNDMTHNMLQKVDDLLSVETVDKVVSLTAVTFEDGVLTIGGQEINNATVLTYLNDLCQGIAVIFVSITFFISLFLTKERELSEEIIKRMIFFVAALACVWYAQDICYAIAGLGTEITNKIAEKITTDGLVDASVKEAVKQKFFEAVYTDSNKWTAQLGESLAAMGLWLELAIPSIAMWAVSVSINVVCWSRAFEIVTLSAFSPLAFADATGMDHFGHGGGSRFIKNMCALSISGAIIVFVMAFGSTVSFNVIYNAVSAGTTSEIISGFKDVLIIAFAEVGLVMKAQSISKTIMGVG